MTEWTAARLAPGLFLFVVAEGGTLRRSVFRDTESPPPFFLSWKRNDRSPVLEQARRELEEYAAGTRRRFEVPFELDGTHFQCEVWKALFEIPYGEVRTYGQLAQALGRAGASRAVGAAAGRNPLPVIVPCHRLIGADGALTGFSAGVAIKKWLLELEGALAGG
mgnify:CR=1 FL=1|jgi:methylated-DNA-[protein]-cysteine S-methyltransferase